MAIDPRISLGVQTPNVNIQAPDPWQRMQRMMTLRDMMQRRELREQEMEYERAKTEQLREKMAADERINALYSRGAGEAAGLPFRPDVSAADVMTLSPRADVSGGMSQFGEGMEAPIDVNVPTLSELPPRLAAPLFHAPPGYEAARPPRRPTEQELFREGGAQAMPYIQQQRLIEAEERKAKAENVIRVGSFAQGILSNPGPESHSAGILQMYQEGLIDEQQAQQFLSRAWYSPETRATLKALVSGSVKATEQWEEERKQAEEARKQRKAELEEPGIIAESAKKLSEAEKEGIQRAAGRLAAAASRGPEAFEAQLAQEAPEHQQFFAGSPSAYEVMKRAQDPDKYTSTVQGEYGKMTPVAPAVFAQQKQLRSTGPPRQPLAVGAADQALADTVIANPALYENLTPSAKTRIAPLLAEKGFTGFGKPMAESAIGQVAQSRSAIESLKDLRTTLKENEQYIGPIGGVQALNPYSEARQAQAKINLVRQRVGKALEGGVLRKEDEEKYKQILATLYDTPSTAIAKVDNLLATLERDIRIFEEEQRRGGRNVPARAEPPPPKDRPPLSSFEK